MHHVAVTVTLVWRPSAGRKALSAEFADAEVFHSRTEHKVCVHRPSKAQPPVIRCLKQIELLDGETHMQTAAAPSVSELMADGTTNTVQAFTLVGTGRVGTALEKLGSGSDVRMSLTSAVVVLHCLQSLESDHACVPMPPCSS